MEIIKNKKAYFDYEIIKKYQAGIVLSGNEIKSIRQKELTISESFVRVNYKDEPFIYNLYIKEYKNAHKANIIDTTRARKLLLNKKEIKYIKSETTQKGLTIVPLRITIIFGKAKVEIAIVRGRKNHDKRQVLKEKDQKREMDKQIKGRV